MLLELRLIYGKMKLRRLAEHFGSVAKLNTVKVMHLTLYGDFRTDRHGIEKIARLIRNLAEKHYSFPFLIDGVKIKKHAGGRGYFAYFNIVPSGELEEFRKQLSLGMQTIAKSNMGWDNPESDFLWYMSISLHQRQESLSRLIEYLHPRQNPTFMEKLFAFLSGKTLIELPQQRTREDLYLPLDALRITLLNDNRRIIFEYDLPTKRILPRRDALDRYQRKKSLSAYRIKKGIEKQHNSASHEIRTLIVSDLHLDHDNIISYCSRPFADGKEMSSVLINNWNKSVDPKDKVFFLGDLAFGRGSRGTKDYIDKLNGEITFISGNHDRGYAPSFTSKILEYGKKRFLLIHDPKDKPADWGGWIIHGHTHNNDIWKYPFINGEERTINASVELIGYQPIDIEQLFSLDFESIRRMDTIESKPIYFSVAEIKNRARNDG